MDSSQNLCFDCEGCSCLKVGGIDRCWVAAEARRLSSIRVHLAWHRAAHGLRVTPSCAPFNQECRWSYCSRSSLVLKCRRNPFKPSQHFQAKQFNCHKRQLDGFASWVAAPHNCLYLLWRIFALTPNWVDLEASPVPSPRRRRSTFCLDLVRPLCGKEIF